MSKHGKQRSGDGWVFVPAGKAKRKSEQAPDKSQPAEKQRIRVRTEKRARGKIVTLAEGFALSQSDLKKLSRDLKSALGSGGSVSEDAIEIQGDHAEAMRDALASRGFGLNR